MIAVLTTIKRVSDLTSPCGLPGMAFQSNPGVILVDLSTPFGMTAELFDGNKVEIAKWAAIEVRVHGFLHVLVSPLPIHVSQEIADDPSLWRFDLLAVIYERPFPDAP